MESNNVTAELKKDESLLKDEQGKARPGLEAAQRQCPEGLLTVQPLAARWMDEA